MLVEKELVRGRRRAARRMGALGRAVGGEWREFDIECREWSSVLCEARG